MQAALLRGFSLHIRRALLVGISSRAPHQRLRAVLLHMFFNCRSGDHMLATGTLDFQTIQLVKDDFGGSLKFLITRHWRSIKRTRLIVLQRILNTLLTEGVIAGRGDRVYEHSTTDWTHEILINSVDISDTFEVNSVSQVEFNQNFGILVLPGWLGRVDGRIGRGGHGAVDDACMYNIWLSSKNKFRLPVFHDG